MNNSKGLAIKSDKSGMRPRYFGENYLLIDLLGRGGMGTVYLAITTSKVKRLISIKVLDPETSNAFREDLFLKEVGFAHQLSHPNITTAFDYGKTGPYLYYSMPYTHGKNLAEIALESLIQDMPLPLEFILYIFHGCMKGLEYSYNFTPTLRGGDRRIHKSKKSIKLVHRDISPQNVMMSYELGTPTILDFGVAVSSQNQKDDKVFFAGKPSYVDPSTSINSFIHTYGLEETQKRLGVEEIKIRQLDHRVDIYSLGVVMWELLTGEKAFPLTGSDELSLARQQYDVITKPLPSVSEFRDVPKELSDIISSMTEKNPLSRPFKHKSIINVIEKLQKSLDPTYNQVDASNFMKKLFASTIETEELFLKQFGEIDIGTVSVGEKIPKSMPGSDETGLFEAFKLSSSETYLSKFGKEAASEGATKLSSEILEDISKVVNDFETFTLAELTVDFELNEPQEDSSDDLLIQEFDDETNVFSLEDKKNSFGKIFSLVLVVVILGALFIGKVVTDNNKKASVDLSDNYKEDAIEIEEDKIGDIVIDPDGIYSSNPIFWRDGEFIALDDYLDLKKKGLHTQKYYIPVGAILELQHFDAKKYSVMINDLVQVPDLKNRVGVPSDEVFKISLIPQDSSVSRWHKTIGALKRNSSRSIKLPLKLPLKSR